MYILFIILNKSLWRLKRLFYDLARTGFTFKYLRGYVRSLLQYSVHARAYTR